MTKEMIEHLKKGAEMDSPVPFSYRAAMLEAYHEIKGLPDLVTVLRELTFWAPDSENFAQAKERAAELLRRIRT